MHAFMLILTILGQPEHATAICETYKQCSDLGAAAQADYVRMFDKRPADFSYRVVPVLIAPEGKTT
jgi:hypothetical protein